MEWYMSRWTDIPTDRQRAWHDDFFPTRFFLENSRFSFRFRKAKHLSLHWKIKKISNFWNFFFGKQLILNLSFRIAYRIKKIHKNPLSGSLDQFWTNARTHGVTRRRFWRHHPHHKLTPLASLTSLARYIHKTHFVSKNPLSGSLDQFWTN